MFPKERWLAARFFYTAKFFGPVAIAFVLLAVFQLAHWPVGDPVRLAGTVRSAGVVSVARLAGGNGLAAVVQLQDGRMVTVVLSHMSNPVQPGQRVKVVEQRLLLATPEYGIAQD